MIHVTRSAHQGQMKVCIRNADTDVVILAVATVNELNFWEGAHSCSLNCFLSWTRRIKSTPNDARLKLAVTQLPVFIIKWRNQHGKVKRLSNGYVTLAVYIQMFPLQYRRSYGTVEHVLKPPWMIWDDTYSHRVEGLWKMYLCTDVACFGSMSVIYGDNVWHHSQSFRMCYHGEGMKVGWYAPVASLDHTICDAWKTCKECVLCGCNPDNGCHTMSK